MNAFAYSSPQPPERPQAPLDVRLAKDALTTVVAAEIDLRLVDPLGLASRQITLEAAQARFEERDGRQVLVIDAATEVCPACIAHLCWHHAQTEETLAPTGPLIRLLVDGYGRRRKSADKLVSWSGSADTECGAIKRAILSELRLTEVGKRRWDLYLGADRKNPMPWDISFGEFYFALVGENLAVAYTHEPHIREFHASLIRRY